LNNFAPVAALVPVADQILETTRHLKLVDPRRRSPMNRTTFVEEIRIQRQIGRR
jgi:antitoxin (DNA-binding transcriptional repressor) of toxin-antitoxin stability system